MPSEAGAKGGATLTRVTLAKAGDGVWPAPGDAPWSLLCLAGYLTADDVTAPDSKRVRSLRIPDREVAQLYRGEVVDRFLTVAGGAERMHVLHRAFLACEHAISGLATDVPCRPVADGMKS